ncbi:MAG TPA: hypothetical protein P5328_00820 [Candidatus Paceibacterota bacterium]|nr:hypothetical protein [Candidatus Paceibacterota bacterium]HRZ34532.1 hypothetical protein [Candidatus Paceibacterota bacterium]
MTGEELFGQVLDFVLFLLPILITVFLVVFLLNYWAGYLKNRFLSEQKYALLRIIPPRDVFKSPAAMELFINALHQVGGDPNPVEKYWKGGARPWFSLEIASNGGDVGFYIWTRQNMSEYLQTQIYAQYPGIEVAEVEDYVDGVDLGSGKYDLWGAELTLTEPDPVPIMTYIDYGLDKTATEEEQKIDPITPTLEFLGSIKPGEFAWIQIIVRAHKKEDKDPKSWFGKTDLWKDDAKKLIQKIREESLVELDTGTGKTKAPLATKGQMEKISAIERSISKLPFDAGIRCLYIAEKDAFNKTNVGGMVGSFKQYSSSALNGFKPKIKTSFDWWEDLFGKKLAALKKDLPEAYKKRDYFSRTVLGKKRKYFILNSEELATIFHFPGGVAQTPSLQRVQSKRSEAPPDLPI